ncbi:MAG: ABC transporter permease [Acidobacteriota bacterium]|nr:ABC transporter permease [Acidobacteriota bacterium]
MSLLVQDVRFGLRMLAKNPGFTSVAVLTLALGIGANTAIFSVVNAVLLRPLPYADADRLVKLDETNARLDHMSVAYLDFRDWQRENHSFTQAAAFVEDHLVLTLTEGAEYVPSRYASADFFSVLGVQLALGRAFLPEEDQQGGRPVVIISHQLWQRHFSGSLQVLGKAVTLNRKAYTVVGVLPGSFQLFRAEDVYIPLGQFDPVQLQDRKIRSGISVVARLKPGITLDQARSDMALVQRRIAQTYPDAAKGVGTIVVPLKQYLVGNMGRTLMLFFVAVGFVLLIACANVANLILARSAARGREFAIRSALGAGRARLIRQLLVESVLFGLMGGALGLAVAAWGTRPGLAAIPGGLPRSSEVGIDPHVLVFTLAISIFTGILFGLAPSLQSTKTNLQESLKERAGGAAGRRNRTQGVLIIAETALTLILLVAAGLMIRTIWRLTDTDPGFDPNDLLTLKTALSPQVASSPEKIRMAFRQLLGQVEGIPGVKAAGLTNMVPLSPMFSTIDFWIGPQTTPPPQADMTGALCFISSPGYLHSMGIPLLRGRLLTREDTLSSPRVVVVDNVLAQRFFPGTDPVGKRINMDFLGPAEIVGVVGHVKHWGLGSDAGAKIRCEIYFPLEQVPDKFMSMTAGGMTVVLRTHSDRITIVPAVRRAIMGPGKDQPVFNLQTMEQVIGASLVGTRFPLILLGIFAGVALLLASVGIYGVVSYSVNRRTHEMGIRMALGAQRGDVLKLVIGQGLRLALIGVGIGIIGALALTRFLSSLLYGVKPTDPVTFIAVSLILTAVALIASYIPARRATKVDPMVALRYE